MNPVDPVETGELDALDVRKAARRLADREGVEIVDLVEIALEALLRRAADGDAVAARALLDRLAPTRAQESAMSLIQLVEQSYGGGDADQA